MQDRGIYLPKYLSILVSTSPVLVCTCLLEQKGANGSFHSHVAERRRHRRRTASCSHKDPYALRLLTLAFPSELSTSSGDSQRTFEVHGGKGSCYGGVDSDGESETSSVTGATGGGSPARALSRSRGCVANTGAHSPVELFKRDETRRRRESRSQGGLEPRLNQGWHSACGSKHETSRIQADFGGGRGFDRDNQDICVRSDAMVPSSLSVRRGKGSSDACRCKPKTISPRREEEAVSNRGGDDADAEEEIARHLLSVVRTAISLDAAPNAPLTNDSIIPELPKPRTVYKRAPNYIGISETKMPQMNGCVSAKSEGRKSAKGKLPTAAKLTQQEDLGFLTTIGSCLTSTYVEDIRFAAGRSVRQSSSESGRDEVERLKPTATSTPLSLMSATKRHEAPVSPFTAVSATGASIADWHFHHEWETSLDDASVSCCHCRRSVSLLEESKGVDQHASDTQARAPPLRMTMSYADNDDEKRNNSTIIRHKPQFPIGQNTPAVQTRAPGPAFIDTGFLENASREQILQHADSRIGKVLYEGQPGYARAGRAADNSSSAKDGNLDMGSRTEQHASSSPAALTRSLSFFSNPWETRTFDIISEGDGEASETFFRHNTRLIFCRCPPHLRHKASK